MYSISTNSSENQTTKRDSLPIITAILFFICISLLLMYLLGMRLYFPLSAAIFWVLVITAISVLVFQIVKFSQPVYEPLFVIEVLMLSTALHLTHIVPFYGMLATDPLRFLAILKTTAEAGSVLSDQPAIQALTAWPLLMTWGVELQHITGITLRNIVQWLPPLIFSGAFVLLLYIFIRRVFGSKQVALLTVLLMVTMSKFTFNGATFKSEIFALLIMMAALYFLTRIQESGRTKFLVLSILCVLGVILSHHLTAFLLLLFLFVCLATNRILSLLNGKWPPSPRKPTLAVTGIFTLLTFVGILSYWIYVGEGPLAALIGISKTLFAGAPDTLLSGAPGTLLPDAPETVTIAEAGYVVNPQDIITFRGRMTFWGYYLFHAVFAIVLLRGLLTRAKEKRPEFYSFTFFLFAVGVWSLVQLYFVSAGSPGTTSMERLMMLGWIWGFAPLAVCVFASKRRWVKQSGIVLLVAFMLFNIYMIAPIKWDLQTPGRAEGQITLREDYALAETIVFSGKVGAFKFTRNAIYDVQGYYAKDLRQVSPDEIAALDSVVIKKKQLEAYTETATRFIKIGRRYNIDIALLNELGRLVTEDSSRGRNRVYDSNNLVLFR